jgi:two-component system, NarL family, response regulator
MERIMRKLNPAVLFIDLALRELDGIKAVPAIQRFSPSTKIILLASKPDPSDELLALKSGARGYCRRDLDPVLFRKAVQMVQKGEWWVGRGVIGHLVKLAFSSLAFKKQSSNHLKELTARQQEIAVLVGNGASNKEIAGALNISESAVKSHLTAIFRKVGLSGRLGLALWLKEQVNIPRSKGAQSMRKET